MSQVWNIALTPAQRVQLFMLTRAEGQEVQGQEGRKYRRFRRAFGLHVIGEAADKNGGRVGGNLADPTGARLFEVTVENLEYLEKLMNTAPRKTWQEELLGDVFDLAPKPPADYQPPADVPPFDATSEDWTPKSGDDPVDVAVSKIAAFVRAANADGLAASIADSIERGEWDPPKEEKTET